MKLFEKLDAKIVGLMLATILISLILVTVFFTTFMNDLYRDSSREKLRNTVSLLKDDFKRKDERLQSTANSLLSDKSFISSVHLVDRYQDTANYMPLVFDAEKEKLLTKISSNVRRAGIGYIATLAMDGSTLAYSLNSESSHEDGFYTYRKESSIPIARINGRTVEKVDIPADRKPGLLVRELKSGKAYRFIPWMPALAVDITLPIFADTGTEKKEQVGWLRLAYFIDQSYVDDFSARSGSQFAVRVAGHTVSSSGFNPVSQQVGSANELGPRHMVEPNWINGEAGQQGAVQLSSGKSEPVQLLFGLSNQEIFSSLDTFRHAVLIVIGFSALLAIPIGIYFTRTTITGPVERLIEHASAIANGQRETLQGFRQTGELGTLAKALNVMVESLDLRERELRSAQKEIDAILSNSPAVIYIKDAEGKYILVNHQYEELFGVTNAAIRGKTDYDIFPESLASTLHKNDQAVFTSLQPKQFEETAQQGDSDHTYLSVKFPLFDDEGRAFAICGISTDITERKKSEDQLLLAKRIIESASEGILVTDLDGNIEDANAAYEKITGYSREEVIGKKPSINQSGKHDKTFYEKMWKDIIESGRWEGEIWDRRKNGELYPALMSINAVYDENGTPTHYVSIFNDITLKKETEYQLEELAYFDALTGLPNRLLFRDRLNHEIASCRRHHSKLAVIFIDLDHFKLINDTQGHLAGDKLLEIIGKRLLAKGRDTDTISRMGGDEFTVVLTDVVDPEQISEFVRDLLASISAPMTVFGKSVQIGASAGVAIYPEDGEDMDSLIKNADIALYQAKEQGRNTYHFYSVDLQEKILARISLERDLRAAIDEQQFVLHYQPKYDLRTREIIGMEALVRWQHPEEGLIPPSRFIPLAEETGLIIPIGDWVLETACYQISQWRNRFNRKLRVAVNLSAAQLKIENLVHRVRDIITKCDLTHDSVELELTESMVMEDVDRALVVMDKLRRLGIHLSIDDFGTGYSSLGYLKRFPLDSVKIDKSFVQDLGKEGHDAAIIGAIIAMADKLRMNVIAEGIESETHLRLLLQAGCTEGQGYYLDKPMPAEELTALLQEARKTG